MYDAIAHAQEADDRLAVKRAKQNGTYQEHRQSPHDRRGWSGRDGSGEWIAGYVNGRHVPTLWAGDNEAMARRRMLREGGR